MADSVGQSSPAEHEELRAKAAAARARAHGLVTQSLLLQATAAQRFDDATVAVDVSKALREELRDVVIQHARVARALGCTPESTVLQIKATAADALAAARAQATVLLPVDERLLRENLVSRTIQGYFSAAP